MVLRKSVQAARDHALRLAAELHVYELLLVVVVVLIRKSRVVGCGAANGRRSILPGRGSAMVIFCLSITIHHCQYNAGAEYCWTRKANRIRARPRPACCCCSTLWFAYLGVETQPGPECRVLLLLTKSQCHTSDSTTYILLHHTFYTEVRTINTT